MQKDADAYASAQAADDPRTQSRAALVASLAEGLAAAYAAGDLEAARIAHEAIGKLLSAERARR